MNALNMLKKDHSTVKDLLSRLEQISETDHERRHELFLQVRRELQLHARAEEEIFYAAVKALSDEGRRLVMEALKQHKDIEELLTAIVRLRPTDRNFDEKVELLIENVDHHIEEEEGEIFQFAEENCSQLQLEELGREIEERKQILDQQMAA